MRTEISSLQHPLVKKTVAIRLDSTAREEAGLILISGRKPILDLARDIAIDTLFAVDALPPVSCREVAQVSAAVLKKITGLEEPDGLAALFPLPKPSSLKDMRRILVLDRVSDPGNLGTLWRTACAFGWDGIWLMPGCVDPFNDKALRAARGATFYLPFEEISSEELLAWGGTLLAADLEGRLPEEIGLQEPFALILGNEGQGVGSWARGVGKVSLPMDPRIESLNVGAAGAILLYQWRGRR